MTKPISDERLADLVDMLGIDTDFDEHGFSVKRGTLRAVFARIEALTAERDAAVAALNMKPHERNSHALGIMEGERRGSAKAVVFMKREYAMDGWDVVNAIERGGHLTQP